MSKKIHKKILKSRATPVTGNFYRTSKMREVVFSAKKDIPLYRFVYSSSTSYALVFLLFVSFMMQGVSQVYAQEITIEETAAPVEVAADSNEADATPITEIVPEESEEILVAAPASVLKNVEAPLSEVVEEVVVAVEEEVVASVDETSEVMPEEVSPVVDIEEAVSSENDPDPVVVEEEQSGSGDGTAEETPEEVVVSEVNQATTSTEVDVLEAEEIPIEEGVTFETVTVTESDSVVSFNKDECTELATGSFYCLQPEENQLQDALFAAPDKGGDLEIYLVRGGVETQITNNTVDDAAPYYDQNTNTIVWHRLINDRFQIISYAIDAAVETQITDTADNNMEPTRQGDYTAWQRWVDGGWNIVLFNGTTEKQITRTTSHNVAPYIHGSLVVWNRHNQNGEKTIEMFDIESDTYVTVDDPDGLSVSNPRMVFVYDSLHPNGDIVTKGYDILARKFIELDSLPRELPDEIPSSDSTGETRALIQSKPTVRSDAEESFGGPNPNVLPAVPVATGTSTEELLTLDLSATSTNQDSFEIPAEQIMADEFDIIITPFQTTESASSTVEE